MSLLIYIFLIYIFISIYFLIYIFVSVFMHLCAFIY